MQKIVQCSVSPLFVLFNLISFLLFLFRFAIFSFQSNNTDVLCYIQSVDRQVSIASNDIVVVLLFTIILNDAFALTSVSTITVVPTFLLVPVSSVVCNQQITNNILKKNR